MKALTCLIAAPVVLAASASHAAVVHNETSDGDLSGVFGTPTALSFAFGDNTVVGQVGQNGNGGAASAPGAGYDADYFSFDIAAGQTLTRIKVDGYTVSGNAGNGSFVGYVAASSFVDQSTVDAWQFFSAGTGDLGFTPLGPGSYSFWVQENTVNSGSVDYQLTFTVVPEPGSLALLGLGGVCLLGRRLSRPATA